MSHPSDPLLLPPPEPTPEEVQERTRARLRQAVRSAVADGLPPSRIIELVNTVLRGAPK